MTDPRVAVEPDVLNRLVRYGCFAADPVAMQQHPTGAARTRAVLRIALEVLLANGLLEAVPPDRWPAYVTYPAVRDTTIESHPATEGVTGITGG